MPHFSFFRVLPGCPVSVSGLLGTIATPHLTMLLCVGTLWAVKVLGNVFVALLHTHSHHTCKTTSLAVIF